MDKLETLKVNLIFDAKGQITRRKSCYHVIMLISAFFIWPILEAREDILQIICCFLEKFTTTQFPSEIIWTLQNCTKPDSWSCGGNCTEISEQEMGRKGVNQYNESLHATLWGWTMLLFWPWPPQLFGWSTGYKNCLRGRTRLDSIGRVNSSDFDVKWSNGQECNSTSNGCQRWWCP